MSVTLDHPELDIDGGLSPEVHADAVRAVGMIPADQALGLRLVALARVASTMHLAAPLVRSATDAHSLRSQGADFADSASLEHSQAARLIALLNQAAGVAKADPHRIDIERRTDTGANR